MRLTSAQIGMCLLLGEQLPGTPRLLAERIRYGHDYLVRLAQIDLGYDPIAWHNHLRTTNIGGYRWSNKHLGFPKRIAVAMVDASWCTAIELLTHSLAEPPTSEPTADAVSGL